MIRFAMKDRNPCPATDKPAYRHELKYALSAPEMAALRSRLGALMRPDAYAGRRDGSYHIRSLYFDDARDSAYWDKLSGVAGRFKYRIRFYNCCDVDIHLERKNKQGNYVYKESADLTRECVEQVLRGDFRPLLADPQPLCQQFYVDCVTRLQRPRVLIDYEREPFVCDVGDVRITFDTNLRACSVPGDLFDGQVPMVNLLGPDMGILEVKYTQLLPSLLRSALPMGHGMPEAVSKFVLACDRFPWRSR